MLDPTEFGKAMATIVNDAIAPLRAEIEQLKAMRPLKGEPGAPGKDADPQEIVRALIATDELAPILELHVAKAVDEYLRENPPKDGADGAPGRDGKDGEKGMPGEKGEPGADGKDGVGLAGAMIDRDGALLVTLTNGEVKSLGPVVGKDGAPGKDGADFSDVEFDWDGERTFIIRGHGKEIRKKVPIVIDRGYWRDGMAAEKGDVMTQDGSAWVALRDTKAKPCRENAEDWRLLARKGRDGRDGRDGKAPPGPVKLGHE